MTANDDDFRRRIQKELAAAETAHDAAVSQIHLELAKRYLEEIETDPDALRGHCAQGSRSTGQIGAFG